MCLIFFLNEAGKALGIITEPFSVCLNPHPYLKTLIRPLSFGKRIWDPKPVSQIQSPTSSHHQSDQPYLQLNVSYIFNQIATTIILEVPYFEPPPPSSNVGLIINFCNIWGFQSVCNDDMQSKRHILSLHSLVQRWSHYWFPRPGSQLVGPVCTVSSWVQVRPTPCDHFKPRCKSLWPFFGPSVNLCDHFEPGCKSLWPF